jgi:geranylgeranyl pyrophosphate synthase
MIDMPQLGVLNLKQVTKHEPDLRERLAVTLDAVETCMYDVVNSDVTVLRDASRHIITAGGKRLRPRLMMLSYLAVGGHAVEEAVPLAAAVELVHTASVVHDDINDHGLLRRGRPSVNSIWGRTFALLTGDFLFTKVYELMGPHRDLNIVLAEATVALVEGETLQAVAVKDNNFTRQVYMDIIARKTAALFRAAAELGARKALGTETQVQALRNFGFNVGLAFQIVDDILDIVGDEAKLGKTAHLDIEQGRGFVMAQESEPTGDVMDSIKRRMLDGDRLEQARQQAYALVQMAIAELDVLPDNETKDELIVLARMTIDREF